MHNQIVEFNIKGTYPLAEKYFIQTSGIRTDSEKHRRMWKRAREIFEEIQDQIKLQAIISDYVPDDISGKNLTISGTVFSCNAFEQLSKKDIELVYIYFLTAGQWFTNSEQVIDQLYSDIWGTSFVDAGRDKLRILLSDAEKNSSSDSFLSESFGPGFYGMDLSQIGSFFKVLDAARLGIVLHKSGMMLPQKTIAGFYFYMKKGSTLPDRDCENCIGNQTGCRFCRAGIHL